MPEKSAQQGQIAQQGNASFLGGLFVFHQAADHDNLATVSANDAVGLTHGTLGQRQ